MATREEEILKVNIDKLCTVSPDFVQFNKRKGGITDAALSAMREYAREMSIGFAEWIRYSPTYNHTHKMWSYKGEYLTTDQLYNIYLTSINKQ